MHLHSEMREVVLNQRGHLHALGIRRTGHNGKVHWPARWIEQLTCAIPGESRGLKQLPCGFNRALGMRKGLVHPQLVARPHVAPQRCSSRAIDQADDGVTVSRRRNRLPAFQLTEPQLFFGNIIQLLRSQVIQVENQKVVFQTGPEIGELPAAARLFFG